MSGEEQSTAIGSLWECSATNHTCDRRAGVSMFQKSVYDRSPIAHMTRATSACDDPLVSNLLVAREIPRLADLQVDHYVCLVNSWAAEIRQLVSGTRDQFFETPGDWDHDIHLFSAGIACYYLDVILGIRYREEQKHLRTVRYTNPADLFINGVIDTRRGTCANMSALYVAIAWRLGWPITLTLAGWHLFCRYSANGKSRNIEVTNNGRGGFHSHPDGYYQQSYQVDDKSIKAGSDLTCLSSRQQVGVFFGLRARHWWDLHCYNLSYRDYCFASHLFPESRLFQNKVLLLRGASQIPVPASPIQELGHDYHTT
jgi:Transglutaminase-like superfamily